MLTKDLSLTNEAIGEYQFTSIQLSFSTADIERTIFYESKHMPIDLGEPFGDVKVIVVHGDVFTLEEGPVPLPCIPLTEESGLFKISKLGGESAPRL